jgi:hypothetical protein
MNEPLLPIRWRRDEIADPTEAAPIIVDGLLRKGELVVIGAPRGVGKSWLGMNIAALAARGEGYVLGRLQVLRRERVLLCHGETEPWAVEARWRQLGVGDEEIADAFEPWRLTVVKVRRFAGDEQEEEVEARLDERLEATVIAGGFGVVIVDPWASYYTGDENDKSAVEAATFALRQVARRTGCAIVVSHHFSKTMDSRDPEDLWRGSTRLPDAASTRLTLLPRYSAKEAEQLGMAAEEARRYVRVRFLRRSDPTPSGFDAVLGRDGWWEALEAPAPATDGDDDGWPSLDELVLALEMNGGRFASVEDACQQLGGLSGARTRRVLAEAVEAGLVVEVRSGGGARGFALREVVEEEDIR